MSLAPLGCMPSSSSCSLNCASPLHLSHGSLQSDDLPSHPSHLLHLYWTARCCESRWGRWLNGGETGFAVCGGGGGRLKMSSEHGTTRRCENESLFLVLLHIPCNLRTAAASGTGALCFVLLHKETDYLVALGLQYFAQPLHIMSLKCILGFKQIFGIFEKLLLLTVVKLRAVDCLSQKPKDICSDPYCHVSVLCSFYNMVFENWALSDLYCADVKWEGLIHIPPTN